MMNINDYKKYQDRTIAEYKVAIFNAEELFMKKIKDKDIIGALEIAKLKIKLENQLNNKIIHRESKKENIY